MATKPAFSGKSLVIVESPAKARTIGKFLGSNYIIEASIGHIRDLPQGAKEVPEKYKKEDWAYLGVNVDEKFEPIYVIPREKSKQVKKLKDALKEADRLLLATDEDREGEAISWHLCQVLNPKVPVQRLVFHEITKEAILKAIENPREVDENLVRAQETRRILDRLYGYDVSPLLWRKVRRGLSAGRVQSVAVRLIVEREWDRMAFVSATYWDLIGQFAKLSGEAFQAILVSVDGRKLTTSRDFDSSTGKIKDLELVGGQLRLEIPGESEVGPGRPDRFVCFLSVLHLRLIRSRFLRQELLTILRADQLSGHLDRHLGQVGRVGTHVSDMPIFI